MGSSLTDPTPPVHDVKKNPASFHEKKSLEYTVIVCTFSSRVKNNPRRSNTFSSTIRGKGARERDSGRREEETHHILPPFSSIQAREHKASLGPPPPPPSSSVQRLSSGYTTTSRAGGAGEGSLPTKSGKTGCCLRRGRPLPRDVPAAGPQRFLRRLRCIFMAASPHGER